MKEYKFNWDMLMFYIAFLVLALILYSTIIDMRNSSEQEEMTYSILTKICGDNLTRETFIYSDKNEKLIEKRESHMDCYYHTERNIPRMEMELDK